MILQYNLQHRDWAHFLVLDLSKVSFFSTIILQQLKKMKSFTYYYHWPSFPHLDGLLEISYYFFLAHLFPNFKDISRPQLSFYWKYHSYFHNYYSLSWNYHHYSKLFDPNHLIHHHHKSVISTIHLLLTDVRSCYSMIDFFLIFGAQDLC